jgi:TAT (twin-arginine translocation) pathway signal sequence
MSDKPKVTKSAVDRRNFMRVLGVGAAATAAPPLASEAMAQGDADEKRKARYRLSEEVKTFYRVNRYP